MALDDHETYVVGGTPPTIASGGCWPWLPQRALGAIVFGDPSQPDDAWKHFDASPALRQVGDVLIAHELFGPIARRLGRNFLMLVLLRSAPGERRIIKLSYDEVFDLGRVPQGDELARLPRWDTLRAALGWIDTPVAFGIPAAADCASYHFEIEAPEGTEVA